MNLARIEARARDNEPVPPEQIIELTKTIRALQRENRSLEVSLAGYEVQFVEWEKTMRYMRQNNSRMTRQLRELGVVTSGGVKQ